MNCQNCGTKLGCGCQKRVAKDGTPCCNKCVDTKNKSLGDTPINNIAPTINKVVYKK